MNQLNGYVHPVATWYNKGHFADSAVFICSHIDIGSVQYFIVWWKYILGHTK